MRLKKTARITVDALMSVLLLLMFAYPWTGNAPHERLGVILFGLFFLHNAFHFSWYRNLPRGRYNAGRAVWTAVNLLLLAAMLLTAWSGLMISQDVFVRLRPNGSFFHRTLHVAAASWGLALTGVHAGLHLPVRIFQKNTCAAAGLKAAGLLLAAYGLYAAWTLRFFHKLFFLETFSRPDTPPLLPLKYLAVAVFFAVLTLFFRRTSGR